MYLITIITSLLFLYTQLNGASIITLSPAVHRVFKASDHPYLSEYVHNQSAIQRACAIKQLIEEDTEYQCRIRAAHKAVAKNKPLATRIYKWQNVWNFVNQVYEQPAYVDATDTASAYQDNAISGLGIALYLQEQYQADQEAFNFMFNRTPYSTRHQPPHITELVYKHAHACQELLAIHIVKLNLQDTPLARMYLEHPLQKFVQNKLIWQLAHKYHAQIKRSHQFHQQLEDLAIKVAKHYRMDERKPLWDEYCAAYTQELITLLQQELPDMHIKPPLSIIKHHPAYIPSDDSQRKLLAADLAYTLAIQEIASLDPRMMRHKIRRASHKMYPETQQLTGAITLSSYAIDTLRLAFAQQLELAQGMTQQSSLAQFFRHYTEADNIEKLTHNQPVRELVREYYSKLQQHHHIKPARTKLYTQPCDVTALPERLHDYITLCTQVLAEKLNHRIPQLKIHMPLHIMIETHKDAELDEDTKYVLKAGIVTLGLCITQGKAVLQKQL